MDKESAVIEQIISERDKNLSEKAKLELEAQEIKQRLSSRWYKNRIAIEAIVGGVVASALLAVWLINYFYPIFSAETELKTLEINKLKYEAADYKSKLDKVQSNLDARVKEYKEHLEIFQVENSNLKKSITEQQANIKQLKEENKSYLKSLTETSLADSESVDNLKAAARESIKSLDEKEASLKQATIDAEDRNISIQKQISAIDNASYLVGIYSLNKSKLHDLVVRYFEKAGYTIDSDWKLIYRPDWFSYDPVVFYYDERSKERAEKVAEDLKGLTKLAFTAKRGAGLGVSKELKDKTFFVHLM